ncbi:MAG: hypothetical protein ABSE73_14025 [Planctomycetota bacterium]
MTVEYGKRVGSWPLANGSWCLAIGSCLLAVGFAASAAEDATAPAVIKEGEAPPPAPGPERPKLRRWLDEPGAKAAGEAPAAALPTPADEAEAEALKATRAEVAAKLVKCKEAFKLADYQRVINIAREILKVEERNIVAAEWMRKAVGKMLDADEVVTNAASERRDREAIIEATQHAVRPPQRMKEVRPHWPRRGEDPETPKYRKMAEKMEQPVTVDFMKADLEWVLNTLFILTGVNIIADQAALEGKSLTLHVEEVPLKEVLNFIVRNNDGIQFSLTEDAVWVTASEAADLKKIMYPRIYPVHCGLVSTAEGGAGGGGGGGSGRSGRGGGGGGGGGAQGGRGGAQGRKGAGGQQEKTFLETILKWLKDAKDLQSFPDGSDYMLDYQSNQLVVFTTASGHDYITKFLDAFDQPPIQVLIKSRFLNIKFNDEKELGVNIDEIKTNGSTISSAATSNTTGTTGTTTGTTGTTTGTTGTTTGTTGTTTGVATAGLPAAIAGLARQTVTNATGINPFHAFDFTSGTGSIGIPGTLSNGETFTLVGNRTNPQFQMTIAALLANQSTKILSEPQVLAVNNKPATIDITTHFSYITNLQPVVTYTPPTVTTGAIPSVPSYIPQFDDEVIGFTLTVTPSVGRDLKTINMHLVPVFDSLSQGQQISQFQNFSASVASQTASGQTPTIQRPTIDQTSLETDVVVEDNGYVIIGGLIRLDTMTQERKVPGLSRIPYLGELFKSKHVDHQKSNMMIIVEAQIITTGGRTYFKDNAPDDAEPREGGTNRSPGQTSQLDRPESITSALGLAYHEPQAPSASPRTARAGKTSAAAAPENQADNPAGQPERPAPPVPKTKTPVPQEVAEAADAGHGQDARAAKGDRQDARPALSPRERMERLARASRASVLPVPVTAPGWAVPEEEGGDGGADAPAEVVTPPKE